MYHRITFAALLVAVLFSVVNASGLCTGYPKTYNGKPCASTTRYWDGQMGACGCGTGNTSPFSWQWTKPTAAASAPIFGSGTWCGSGCGKCFKLTPTGAGASVVGKGAPNTNSLVVKVTNLCPYSGNEEWCAMDVNSHDYDAHFDLMDYNMNGIITQAGWDNPEVTYEEVDCASNGYTDWSCQCASGANTVNTPSSAPTTKATTTAAPVTTAKAPSTGATTKATTTTTTSAAPVTTAKATTAPVTTAPVTTTAKAVAPTTTTAPVTTTKAPTSSTKTPVTFTLKPGANGWWLGFSTPLTAAYSKIEVKDAAGGALPSYVTMTYHGDQYWGMYFVNPPSAMKLPLTLRFTNSAGASVEVPNVISSWTTTAEINAGVSL